MNRYILNIWFQNLNLDIVDLNTVQKSKILLDDITPVLNYYYYLYNNDNDNNNNCICIGIISITITMAVILHTIGG